jgi:hypothetical protein
MSPYSVKIFSGEEAFENRPVLTLQEDNRRTTAKFESVWHLSSGRTSVPMNESKALTHNMTVSPVAFRDNLRLSPAPAHTQTREVGPSCLSVSAICVIWRRRSSIARMPSGCNWTTGKTRRRWSTSGRLDPANSSRSERLNFNLSAG